MMKLKRYNEHNDSYEMDYEEIEPLMNRFRISDHTKNSYHDDMEGFIIVEEKIISTDNEKGFSDIRVILKQDIDDGRFFSVTYTVFGYNGSDFLDQTAYEVQRKTKIIYYYE